jgi:Flp pilus assembly protein TadB
VDLVSWVSNNDQRLTQNVLRNLLSQLEMMVFGIPNWTHTRLKKILKVSSAMMVLLQVMRMAILKNRSTTKNTQSLPCLVDGKPNM